MREVVTASREGGASLNVLSGFVAGNFSAYWLGIVIVVLMGIAYRREHHGAGRPHGGAGRLRLRPGGLRLPGHGSGDHRRRLVRAGDRQRAVRLRAVGHRADPGIEPTIRRQYGFDVDFEAAKQLLEENDGAGNTFKATAKPVLIGTAVVGATTMIFSIIVVLDPRAHPEPRQALAAPPAVPARPHHGRRRHLLVHGRRHPGRVSTGAYRAVEFIKANIRLDGAPRPR